MRGDLLTGGAYMMPGTRIFITGKFCRRDELEGKSEILRKLGYELVSRWTWEDDGGDDFSTWRAAAYKDLEDVRRCEVLIWFTEPRGANGSTNGRVFEAGYAHGLGKRLITIGDQNENIYCHLDEVENYATWEAFLDSLSYMELQAA